MTKKSNIELHLAEKIKSLTYTDLDAVNTYLYTDREDLFLLYILDNLDQFHEQVDMEKGGYFESYFFYWDISKDTVLPYLAGEWPHDFHKSVRDSDRKYISLCLDIYRDTYSWTLFVFTPKFFTNSFLATRN